MGGLIDDLRAFSHVARADLRKVEVDLNELVQDTLRDFQKDMHDRNMFRQCFYATTVRLSTRNVPGNCLAYFNACVPERNSRVRA
jgi:signal transduction histidine kinase